MFIYTNKNLGGIYMTEQVKIKSTGQMGCVEYYEGAGMYAIKLENGSHETFHEHDIECLNFEPYPNDNSDVIKKLILLINSEVKAFECTDIDTPSFVKAICRKTGLSEEEYYRIMDLNEEEDDDEFYNSDKEE